MKSDSLDLDLPQGPGLPPPPPMELDAMLEYNARRIANYYQSPYYEEWCRRTMESKSKGEPFVME
jgi:hypothetical protein